MAWKGWILHCWLCEWKSQLTCMMRRKCGWARQAVWIMNEWINVHDYSDTITVNCCRGTVQMLWVGSPWKSVVFSRWRKPANDWQRRPDTSWQGVPDTCSCYWKCLVAECGSASWRHDECWRARRSESTPSINFSGQLKCLGEVRWCRTMQTPMSQNTQPVLDPLRYYATITNLWGNLHTYCQYLHITTGHWLAVWLSGDAFVSINVVALRRAQLVPGWVTVFGRVNYLGT